MLKTLRQIISVGIISEPPPQPDEELRIRDTLQANIRGVLGRALCIRHIDAGSCNGCELEIHALNNPLYNLEGARHSIRPKSAAGTCFYSQDRGRSTWRWL
jgi:hypothetical protein